MVAAMSQEFEEWQIADSIGSFEYAMEVMRQRYKSGETIEMTGYFARRCATAPIPEDERDK